MWLGRFESIPFSFLKLLCLQNRRSDFWFSCTSVFAISLMHPKGLRTEKENFARFTMQNVSPAHGRTITCRFISNLTSLNAFLSLSSFVWVLLQLLIKVYDCFTAGDRIMVFSRNFRTLENVHLHSYILWNKRVAARLRTLTQFRISVLFKDFNHREVCTRDSPRLSTSSDRPRQYFHPPRRLHKVQKVPKAANRRMISRGQRDRTDVRRKESKGRQLQRSGDRKGHRRGFKNKR